ncbi:hypothetical protein CkaCkLH20_05115 [Colletotrichum karsti]|uniref:Uncharacterized protein n=1 Tax=Colletotrichum karsti TaxID=1095194 RepID=A0A9P6I7R0_9PEZI|nr:uncharacterized protein CkaCkLH20_05115 [Colletotrichum karsti]KAF9877415.1 hypothetical protein CkaCkLH20_05115 [Colletotrichum karsti]
MDSLDSGSDADGFAVAKMQRDARKRELRDLRLKEEKEKKEMEEGIEKTLEHEKKKVSEIEAAIRALQKSTPKDAKTPINVKPGFYNLYSVRHCQLMRPAKIHYGNSLSLYENMGDGSKNNSNEGDYEPWGDIELDNGSVSEPEVCEFKPFDIPKFSGKVKLPTNRRGGGETVEITFHNEEYIELKLHADLIFKLADGEDRLDLSEGHTDDTPYYHFFGAQRTPDRAREEREELQRQEIEARARYERNRSPSPRDTWFENNHFMGAYYDRRYAESW